MKSPYHTKSTGKYSKVTLYSNDPRYVSGLGHYTQIIWKETRQIGCGFEECDASQGGLRGVMVCNYYPPGNRLNHFRANIEC